MRFFILLMTFLLMTKAWSIPVKRQFQDMKLVTQQLIEKQTISNPNAASNTSLLNGDDGPTSAAAHTISSGFGSIDVPRNLTVTPGGTTAEVGGCDVTISGTNFFDSSISEAFTITENQSTTTTGDKAFKTITSVAFPASCEDSAFGATWSVGYGEKLGLKRCMGAAGDLVQSSVDGVYESTRATIAFHVTQIEDNTADFNGTMDASADFDIYFFQNFRCFP